MDEIDNRISFELAVATSFRFGLDEKKARQIVEDIKRNVIDNWEVLAVRYGISRAQIEEMRPAFSECYRT